MAGDNCIDAYEGAGNRSCAVGGNALNVAVDLARLGVACDYFGIIGNDDRGRQVREAAEGAGVNHHLRVVEGSTWITFVRTDSTGTTRIVRQDPGACGQYVPTVEELELLSRCDHVHMANVAHAEAAVAALKRKGVTTSYDHGTEGDLSVPVDVAFFSCDGPGASRRGIEIAKEACGNGAGLAVVTLGPAGSLAFDGKRLMRQSARQVHPVDTLGAGDSYIAAFLARRLAGGSIESAMRAAREAAYLTCLHWAAWPQNSRHGESAEIIGEGRHPDDRRA